MAFRSPMLMKDNRGERLLPFVEATTESAAGRRPARPDGSLTYR